MNAADHVVDDPNPQGPWLDYELAAGALVFAGIRPQKLLLLQRADGRYTLPKGHLTFGEDRYEAALRELQEEKQIHGADVQCISFLGYFPNPILLTGGKTVFKLIAYYAFVADERVMHQVVVDSEHVGFTWLEPPDALRSDLAYRHTSVVIQTGCEALKRSQFEKEAPR